MISHRPQLFPKLRADPNDVGRHASTSTTRDSEEEEEDGCASADDDVDEAPLSSHKADDANSSVLRPAVAILPTHARQTDGNVKKELIDGAVVRFVLSWHHV